MPACVRVVASTRAIRATRSSMLRAARARSRQQCPRRDYGAPRVEERQAPSARDPQPISGAGAARDAVFQGPSEPFFASGAHSSSRVKHTPGDVEAVHVDVSTLQLVTDDCSSAPRSSAVTPELYVDEHARLGRAKLARIRRFAPALSRAGRGAPERRRGGRLRRPQALGRALISVS